MWIRNLILLTYFVVNFCNLIGTEKNNSKRYKLDPTEALKNCITKKNMNIDDVIYFISQGADVNTKDCNIDFKRKILDLLVNKNDHIDSNNMIYITNILFNNDVDPYTNNPHSGMVQLCGGNDRLITLWNQYVQYIKIQYVSYKNDIANFIKSLKLPVELINIILSYNEEDISKKTTYQMIGLKQELINKKISDECIKSLLLHMKNDNQHLKEIAEKLIIKYATLMSNINLNLSIEDNLNYINKDFHKRLFLKNNIDIIYRAINNNNIMDIFDIIIDYL